MKKLQELLEDVYEDFESLENVEKSSYVPGSELWEEIGLGLACGKYENIKLYDSDSGSGELLNTQSLPGERKVSWVRMLLRS